MSDTKPTLLVLAAGMGSRYGGLKQLDGMGPNGETILDYSIFDALDAGFGKVVFIIRKDFEQAFRDAVGKRYEGKVEVDYVFQELDCLPDGHSAPEGREKPWGTAHAIMLAGDAVREPFGVINADDYYGRESYGKLAAFLSNVPGGAGKPQYSMVGFHLKNTLSEHGGVTRGICEQEANGLLKEVVETSGIARVEGGAECPLSDGGTRNFNGEELVSMNMWGFTPEIFGQLTEKFDRFLTDKGGEMKSEFFIPVAVDELIAEGKADVHVLDCNGVWFGVTYKEDKPIVERSLRELIVAGVYPASLWG